MLSCALTIAGAGRDTLVVMRRGRCKTVCARGTNRAAPAGRSASTLAARMRHHVLLLLMTTTLVHAEPQSALLDRLAQELKSMRSLPVGTPTHSTCPKDSSSLVGLAHQQVKSKLGEPDFIDADGSWSYFFTSSVPVGQDGGGFPQLTFGFDAKGRIAHVSCYYSR